MNMHHSRFAASLVFALLLANMATTERVATANPALRGYANYDSMKSQLEELAACDAASLSSLGETLGGRHVYLLTVGQGKTDDKPAILILGNAHEPHLLGSELALRVARRLLQPAGQEKELQSLLRDYTLYIIPRPNPDGSERLFDRPWRERAGNERRTDDDRDFRAGEDPPDDLNADGWITMMRVRDETGPYMPHPDDARIMIEADPKKNEQGAYRLYTEGKDDDADERWNEDASDGVSFNRNFAFRYPYFESGAGPHQVSEAETRIVADFAYDHPNIAVVFAFTPEDNLMRPWKPGSSSERSRIRTSVMSADAPYFDFLARRYREIHEGKDAPGSPTGAGAFSEWAYYHYGRWSLGARAWWPPKTTAPASSKEEQEEAKEEPQGKQDQSPDDGDEKQGGEKPSSEKPSGDKRGADDLQALQWLTQEGLDGFVEWTPVELADFPDRQVEVGGFKPFYRLNPPVKELDPLAEKHLEFFLELAALLPRLKIHSTTVDSLGGGVFRIRAVVANLGYLPTLSAMGAESRVAYPLQIALELPEGAKLIQGPARRQLERLDGNGGRAEQTWVVRLADRRKSAARIRVWAPAVGAVETSITLKTDAAARSK